MPAMNRVGSVNRVASMNRVASTANLMRHVTAAGRAEYIGVALPIDVTMLFEVSPVSSLIVSHRNVFSGDHRTCIQNKRK